MEQYDERILVVEDDVQIRNFISYALKNEGFAHSIAANAQTALNILVSEKIDLMLLDLGLPDLDGKEIVHRLREWTKAPIVILSARDQEQEKVEVLDAGADSIAVVTDVLLNERPEARARAFIEITRHYV